LKFGTTPVAYNNKFLIDPADVIVKPGLNARHAESLDMDHVRRLAWSFLNEGGQKQPVQIRKEGDKAVLVAGHHRRAACLLLNGKLDPDDPRHDSLRSPRPVKLECVFSELNEEEAYRDSIIENRRRKATTAIDDAHNQRKLREVYKWTEEQIADLYDTTPAKLAEVATLLRLPPPVQAKIAAREIPTAGALALAALPPDEQSAALAAAVLPTGRVRGETIRNAVAEKKREAGAVQARRPSEVTAEFEAIAGDETLPKCVRDYARAFLRFREGKIGVAAHRKALTKLAEVDGILA